MEATSPTSKSARPSGSEVASSALWNERVVPAVTGSFRMNLTALGFGVSSMLSIFGISNLSKSIALV